MILRIYLAENAVGTGFVLAVSIYFQDGKRVSPKAGCIALAELVDGEERTKHTYVLRVPSEARLSEVSSLGNILRDRWRRVAAKLGAEISEGVYLSMEKM